MEAAELKLRELGPDSTTKNEDEIFGLSNESES